MVAVQIGLIVFLIFVLAIVYHDEYKRRRLERKLAKLNSFWDGGKERRKGIRINTEIDVLYEAASERQTQKKPSISRNISVGGINLALNEKLTPNTSLNLQLNIPQGPKPILTQGKVMWVREINEKFSREKDQRFFATGIRFTQLTPADEAVLRNFIKERLRKAPEQETPYYP